MRIAVAALAAIFLTACAARGPAGRYVGEVTSVPLVPGAVCTGKTQGVLDLADNRFVFVPTAGVLSLYGTLTSQGVLHGERSFAAAKRGTDPLAPSTGHDKKQASATAPSARMLFDGHLAGDRIEGTFTTPRCRASVELMRRA